MWYNKECNGGVTWLTHTQQCVTHLKQIRLNIFHGDIDFIGIYWVYVQWYIQLLHIDIYRYSGVSESQTIQTNLSAILEPEYCTTQTWEFSVIILDIRVLDWFRNINKMPYMYIHIYIHTQCFSWFRLFNIIQDAKTIQKVWKGRSSTTSPLRKKHVYFLAPPWPVGMASKLGTSCHPQGTWSWLDDAREYPHFRSFRKRPYIYNIYICIIYIYV